jgi:hypothetical protein
MTKGKPWIVEEEKELELLVAGYPLSVVAEKLLKSESENEKSIQ